MMLVSHIVLVFKSRCVGRTALLKTTVGAAFKIIDACNVILVVKAQSVSHQYQMDLFVVLHFDCVNTIDSR